MSEIQYKNLDLDLPQWGPYAKHYAGISYIVNTEEERRPAMIDFIPLIGRMRGKTIVPDINFESDYHLWEATEDLKHICYRYQLTWKDREYVEVFFHEDLDGRLCQLVFHNNTDLSKEYVASIMSVLRTEGKTTLHLQEDEQWIAAESYQSLQYCRGTSLWVSGQHYEQRCHTAQLGMGKDGLRKGVCVGDFLVDGFGLGNCLAKTYGSTTADNATFLMQKGTTITYVLSATKDCTTVTLRYALYGVSRLDLVIATSTHQVLLSLTPTQVEKTTTSDSFGYCTCSLPLEGASMLSISVQDVLFTEERPSFILDGLLLGNETDCNLLQQRFSYNQKPTEVEVARSPEKKGVGITYPKFPFASCAMLSDSERARPPHPYSDCTITHVLHDELSGQRILRKLSNDSLFNWYDVNCRIEGNQKGHFVGYNIGPIVCEPKQTQEVYIALVCGNLPQKEQERKLNAILQRALQTARVGTQTEEETSKRVCASFYQFGMQRLLAYIFSNVTYPVQIGNSAVRTYTPGKRWGGLFTWDSGMHGIGLCEYEPYRAAQIVNQYMVDPEQEDVALVMHGSPLPLHIYLLLEIYKKTKDKDLLSYFYPRAMNYYAYFSGLHPLSRFDVFSSGLLNPYAEGYNTLGIDDYPVQHEEGVNGWYGKVSTVSATAHAIRTGQIMKLLARELGKDDDIAHLDEHLRYLSEALLRWSWDDESGYFNHVFDETKEQVKYKDGHSYNMGLDGVSPLLTTICSQEQKERLIGHIMTEGEMWTPFGITSVSLDAPYSRNDGYWNGKVWIPHQWFLFKAMIGHAQLEHAEKIAHTALSVWQENVEDTYNCYELFDGTTGMGQGCHHFAGLSAPLASFYNAYYRPYQVTTGFDVMIESQQVDEQKQENTFVLVSPFYQGKSGVICAVPSKGTYSVSIGREEQTLCVSNPYLQFEIADASQAVTVKVRRVSDEC